MSESIKFGVSAKDKITGLKGIITAKAEYITGCNQYLLQPKVSESGDFKEGKWVDEGRIEIDWHEPVIEISDLKAEENGCDIPAPTK